MSPEATGAMFLLSSCAVKSARARKAQVGHTLRGRMTGSAEPHVIIHRIEPVKEWRGHTVAFPRHACLGRVDRRASPVRACRHGEMRRPLRLLRRGRKRWAANGRPASFYHRWLRIHLMIWSTGEGSGWKPPFEFVAPPCTADSSSVVNSRTTGICCLLSTGGFLIHRAGKIRIGFRLRL